MTVDLVRTLTAAAKRPNPVADRAKLHIPDGTGWTAKAANSSV